MRIHTSLTADQLHAIAREVDTRLHARITTHGSRSHTYGHEVVLTTADKLAGEKRRQASAYGVPFGDSGEYGATYAEWGWFLAKVFDADSSPYGPKAGPYGSHQEFDERTEGAFDADMVHLRIPAADIQPGDVLVGDNIQGSGVKPVRAIERKPGERNLTATYTWRGGRDGEYLWEGEQKMNPKRIVTVARYL